jgi:hypothetical protein
MFANANRTIAELNLGHLEHHMPQLGSTVPSQALISTNWTNKDLDYAYLDYHRPRLGTPRHTRALIWVT